MYCHECGATNRDEAVFCAECGASLSSFNSGHQEDVVAQTSFGIPVSTQKTISKNKLIGLIVAGVALLTVIVLGAVFIPKLFFGRSIEQTCKMAADYVNGDTSIDPLSLFPEEVSGKIVKSYGLTSSQAKKKIKDYLKNARRTDGIRVKDIRVLDKEKILAEDLEDSCSSEYGPIASDAKERIRKFYNGDYVREACTAELEIDYRYDGEQDSETFDMMFIKVGNSWYLAPELLAAICYMYW